MKKRADSFIVQLRTKYQLYLMVLPAALFFVVFNYIPMAGIYFAFTNFNFYDGLWRSPFVGLANFRFLVSGGILLHLTVNTVLYNVAFILINAVFSIGVAVLLNEVRNRAFKRVTQTVMFLPYFISFVLVAAFVYNIFNYEYGVVNTTLKVFGLPPANLYNRPTSWIFILVGINLWKYVGYNTIIYLAAITAIDDSILQAAEIDGASIPQRIRWIILPHLVPTFMIILIFSVGSIMRGQFDMFYNVIGSNGVLYQTTDILDTYVYRTLRVNFNINMAAAAGVYQSIFGLVVVLLVNGVVRKLRPEYALF